MSTTTYAPPTDEAVRNAVATLDLITKHPDAHDQGTWADPFGDIRTSGGVNWERVASIVGEPLTMNIDCGSTACYAGWLAVTAGEHLGYMKPHLSDVVVMPHANDTHTGTGIDFWGTDHLGLFVPYVEWGSVDLPDSPAYDYLVEEGVTHPFSPECPVQGIAQWVRGIQVAAHLEVDALTGMMLVVQAEGDLT